MLPGGSSEASSVFTNTDTWTAARPNAAGSSKRGMAEVVSWSHQQVATDQARDLDRELGDAADEDADRQRQDRRLHVSREQHDTGDHSDVHDGGPDGGREKVAVDLEHPHRQRGQAEDRKSVV